MRAKKYKEGETIHTIQYFMECINTDNYVMFRGKPKHYGFIIGWPLKTILHCIAGGRFKKAVLNG
jgi:hypothetical protein